MRAMGIMPPQQKKKTAAKKGATFDANKAADNYIAKMRAMGIMLDPKDSSSDSEDTQSDVNE
jgi:hypothetical protein